MAVIDTTLAPKQLKVAVVGGGPGGLATAIALSKIPGVEVQVFEKDKVLREVGAGINISANSWNILELLGVADSLVSGHQSNVVLNVLATPHSPRQCFFLSSRDRCYI